MNTENGGKLWVHIVVILSRTVQCQDGVHAGQNIVWNHISILKSYAPTIFWFLNYENEIDILLDSAALMGMILSALIIIQGSANMIMMTTIWVLYHSIVRLVFNQYTYFL